MLLLVSKQYGRNFILACYASGVLSIKSAANDMLSQGKPPDKVEENSTTISDGIVNEHVMAKDGQKQCLECHKFWPGDYKGCPKCFVLFEQSGPVTGPSSKKHCQQCSKYWPGDFKICPICYAMLHHCVLHEATAASGYTSGEEWGIDFSKYLKIQRIVKGSWADQNTDLANYIGGQVVAINSCDVATVSELKNVKEAFAKADYLRFTIQQDEVLPDQKHCSKCNTYWSSHFKGCPLCLNPLRQRRVIHTVDIHKICRTYMKRCKRDVGDVVRAQPTEFEVDQRKYTQLIFDFVGCGVEHPENFGHPTNERQQTSFIYDFIESSPQQAEISDSRNSQIKIETMGGIMHRNKDGIVSYSDPPVNENSVNNYNKFNVNSEGVMSEKSSIQSRPALMSGMTDSLANESAEPTMLDHYDIGNYILEKTPLGHGSFGTVYKGHRPDNENQKFAIKVLHSGDPRQRAQEEKEFELLKKANHKYIITVVDSFFYNNQFCVVSEFANAGDLRAFINEQKTSTAKWNAFEVSEWFTQIVSDFGLAKEFGTSKKSSKSKVGTELYMSPEMINRQGYSFANDVWSLGCILFELCMLRRAFDNVEDVFNEKKIDTNIRDFPQTAQQLFKSPKRDLKHWRELSIACSRSLHRNKTLRPTCIQLLTQMLQIRMNIKAASKASVFRNLFTSESKSIGMIDYEEMFKAVEEGDSLFVKAFLDIEGVQVDVKNEHGQSAWLIAGKNSNKRFSPMMEIIYQAEKKFYKSHQQKALQTFFEAVETDDFSKHFDADEFLKQREFFDANNFRHLLRRERNNNTDNVLSYLNRLIRDDALLHKACIHNCFGVARAILFFREADVNEKLKLYSDVLGCNERVYSDCCTALHVAGQDTLPLLLCDPDIKVNTTDLKGRTALSLAAEEGHDHSCKELLQHRDINVNYVNRLSEDETALHIASRLGHHKVFQELLGHDKIDVNQKTVAGKSALHFACEKGFRNIVQDLLGRPELDVNQTTEEVGYSHTQPFTGPLKQTAGSVTGDFNHHREGTFALYIAAEHDFRHIVRDLLGRPELDVNKTTQEGRSALHVAAKHGFENIVKDLLGHNEIDVNKTTKQGESALLIAVQHGFENIVKDFLGRPEIIVDHLLGSALCIASELGFSGIVEAFLVRSEIVLDVNKTIADETTALHIASKHGLRSIVQDLLTRSELDVNKTNVHEESALYMACKFGFRDIVHDLLDHAEINVNKKTVNQESALYTACQHGFGDIVQDLLNHRGINVKNCFDTNKGKSTLFLLCQGWWSESMLPIFERIISRADFDVNVAVTDAGFYSSTLLHVACQAGRFEIVEHLLRRLDIELNKRNGDDTTPLWIACSLGHHRIVSLLLSRLIDVNGGPDANNMSNPSLPFFLNHSGKTPLYIASEKGHLDVVRLLLNHSEIDVDKVADNGWTAWFVANQRNHDDIAQLLEHRSAVHKSTKFESKPRLTALHIAASEGHLILTPGQNGVMYTADVNHVDAYGRTALYVACYRSYHQSRGHYEMVQHILSLRQVDVNRAAGLDSIAASAVEHSERLKQIFGQTPLYAASKNGHRQIVKILLDRPEIDVNKTDSLGFTPLHVAAANGYAEVVQDFLSHPNVDSDILNTSEKLIGRTLVAPNQSAADTAGQLGHQMIVDMLVSGVRLEDASKRNSQPSSTTDVVPKKVSELTEVTEKKLFQARSYRKKAFPKTVSEPEVTDKKLFQAVSCNNAKLFKKNLVHATVDVNASNSNQYTLCTRIILEKHTSLLKILLAHPDHNINKQDASGFTPLTTAVGNSNTDVLSVLLNCDDIDVNLPNAQGQTALVICVLKHNVDMLVLLLLDKRIDVNFRSSKGHTPLTEAFYSDATPLLVDSLMEKRQVPDYAPDDEGDVEYVGDFDYSFHRSGSSMWKIQRLYSEQERSLKVLKLLLTVPTLDVNMTDSKGSTPLQFARSKRHPLTGLLQSHHSYDIEWRDFEINESSASVALAHPDLHSAAKVGNYTAIAPLVESGFHPDEKDHDGKAPFDHVVEYFKDALGENNTFAPFVCADPVRLLRAHYFMRGLIAHGADVNQKNPQGLTALHQAVLDGQRSVMVFLIKNGADVKRRDHLGRTVLQFAVLQFHKPGTKDIIKFLREFSQQRISVTDLAEARSKRIPVKDEAPARRKFADIFSRRRHRPKVEEIFVETASMGEGTVDAPHPHSFGSKPIFSRRRHRPKEEILVETASV